MKESLDNLEKCIKEKQSIDRAYSTINIENERIKSSRDEVDNLRKSTTLDLAKKEHLIDDSNQKLLKEIKNLRKKVDDKDKELKSAENNLNVVEKNLEKISESEKEFKKLNAALTN